MAVDLQQLSQVLEASLDPSKNKQGTFTLVTGSQEILLSLMPAELAILQEEKKPNFSLCLLQIVASDTYNDTTRLASALYFKNYIKKNWTVSTPPLYWLHASSQLNISRMKMGTIASLKTRFKPLSKSLSD